MSDSPRRSRRMKPGKYAERLKGKPATDSQLREFFNQDRVVEKTATGDYTKEILENDHPSPPRANEPICTRSQLIAYFDEKGKLVAKAHQYVRPDGKLGA